MRYFPRVCYGYLTISQRAHRRSFIDPVDFRETHWLQYDTYKKYLLARYVLLLHNKTLLSDSRRVLHVFNYFRVSLELNLALPHARYPFTINGDKIAPCADHPMTSYCRAAQ